MIFQAGDSDQGREFAAAKADAIFSRHSRFADGQAFYADVKGRLAKHGRRPEDLVILPAATFMLGDTDEEARDAAHEVRRQQVSGPTAMLMLEQLWNRDLSAYDPDGPLPDIDPLEDADTFNKGTAMARSYKDRLGTAKQWREIADAGDLSIRELIIKVTGRQSFIGSPSTVAAEIDRFVQEDASDGFILVPHLTPGGMDDFADRVVPLLQERGVFRTEYEGTTLRDHLGLAPLGARLRVTRSPRAYRAALRSAEHHSGPADDLVQESGGGGDVVGGKVRPDRRRIRLRSWPARLR